MAGRRVADPKVVLTTQRWTMSEAAALDQAASAANQTRSAYVRDAVRRVLASDTKKAARLKGQQP